MRRRRRKLHFLTSRPSTPTRPFLDLSQFESQPLNPPPSLPTSSAHPTTQLSSPSCEIFLSLYAARQSSDPPILQVLLIPRNLGLRSSVCLVQRRLILAMVKENFAILGVEPAVT